MEIAFRFISDTKSNTGLLTNHLHLSSTAVSTSKLLTIHIFLDYFPACSPFLKFHLTNMRQIKIVLVLCLCQWKNTKNQVKTLWNTGQLSDCLDQRRLICDHTALSLQQFHLKNNLVQILSCYFSIKSRWKQKEEKAKEQNSSWPINQWTRWIFSPPCPLLPTNPNLDLCLPTKQFLVFKWKVANIMYIIQNDHYSAGGFFFPLLF